MYIIILYVCVCVEHSQMNATSNDKYTNAKVHRFFPGNICYNPLLVAGTAYGHRTQWLQLCAHWL